MDTADRNALQGAENEKKRIFIADDDENIRMAIRTFLLNEGYLVEDFPTGDLLLAAFEERGADLCILDVMMPGRSGFDICRLIREKSTVPIIMLTARDTDIDYATGMSLGSDDYFTKPFSAMALVMRVKAIFRRIAYERAAAGTSHVLSAGRLRLDADQRTVTGPGGEIALTPTEYDLLKYLLEKRQTAVSRDELLEKVWGYESQAESRATDDTVRRLRRKLEGTGVSIESVWGFGFRLTEAGK